MTSVGGINAANEKSKQSGIKNDREFIFIIIKSVV